MNRPRRQGEMRDFDWQSTSRTLFGTSAALASITSRATHPEMQLWQAVSPVSHGSKLQETMQSKTFRQFASAPQASRAVEQTLAKLAIAKGEETRVTFSSSFSWRSASATPGILSSPKLVDGRIASTHARSNERAALLAKEFAQCQWKQGGGGWRASGDTALQIVQY